MTVTNTVPPAISGNATQGQFLTTTNGTWTYSLAYLTYAYQWLRCDAAGANCVNILNATSSTYGLTAADVGSTIRSEVTATETGSDPTPPPPPAAENGVGTLRYGSTNPPPNPTNYSFLVSSWDKAPVFGAVATPPIKLHYASQVSLVNYATQNWHAGVTLAFAQANNLILQKQGGGNLMNVSYNRPLGDLGDSAYQDEWVSNMRARCLATGVEGVFIDDTQYFYNVMTGGAISAKYPTQASWMAAVVSFAQAISDGMRPDYYVAYNATGYHDPATEAVFSGDPDLALFTALGPYADGLYCEYWQSRPNIPGYIRKRGSGWTNHWDEWQRLPAYCAANSVDFMGQTQAPGSASGRDYVIASTLLEGGSTFYNTASYDSSTDPWNSGFARVAALGDPTGSKVTVGNQIQRQYDNGLVWVNPVLGTYQL